MENYLSRDKVKVILESAPKGSNKEMLIDALVSKGYVLEGFNEPKQEVVEPKKTLGQKTSDAITSFFPGDKIGDVIGTEIAKARATPEERQFIQQDVTGRELAGEALQIGSFLFPYGKVAGAVGGKVLGGASKLTPTAIKTAKTVGDVASGVAGGYMADLGFNLEDNSKTLGESFIPGFGTAIGGAIPLAGPAVRAVKGTKTPEKVIGRVLQGQTKDIPLAEKAFKNMDLTGVSTRQELSERLSQSMSKQMDLVDDVLSKDTRRLSLDDYAIRATNEAGGEVKTDFISKAFDHLEDFYLKAGDEVSASNLNLLRNRAVNEGLTHQEVNKLARMYSEEFGSKAFNKMGDPLTSVNAQMYENTRQALKQGARGGLGYGDEAQKADQIYSAMSNTKNLIDKGVEGVNKLEQRLKDYNILQKVSRNAVKMLNTLTGGSLKAGIEALGVSNVGNKIDNWVNLEKSLRKDLEFIQKINTATTEKGIIKAIEDAVKRFEFPGDKIINKLDEASKLPNKQGGFVGLPQSKLPAIQRSTTETKNIIPKTSNISKSSTKSTTKSIDPLISEAKKYKSSDEFINAIRPEGVKLVERAELQKIFQQAKLTDSLSKTTTIKNTKPLPQILEDAKFNFSNPKKIKLDNKSFYRGQTNEKISGADSGGADLGKGLYFTNKKNIAKQYGDVVNINSTDLPKNPLRFDTRTKFDGFLAELKKAYGIKSESDVGDFGKLIRTVGNYDGVIIGDGEIVVTYKNRLGQPRTDIFEKANKK